MTLTDAIRRVLSPMRQRQRTPLQLMLIAAERKPSGVKIRCRKIRKGFR